MNPQERDDLQELIDQRNGIIEDMRAILVQQGDDHEILREARIALSDWFVATYPHLYPGHGRPQLRVIGGEGSPAPRCDPARYTADRICLQCGMLTGVQVVVQDPQSIGYRCDRGHMWTALRMRS